MRKRPTETVSTVAFFHPQRNMFLSLAHRPADIDEALQAALHGFLHGFKAVRELEARSNR